VCSMSLRCVGVQVWGTETVDGHGQGQVETRHVNGLRAVKDRREAWIEEPRWPKD
jgi:cobalamin biosynthesis Mg chelatase CobN